ncbi:uncharacterized protein LOC116344492 [Contarinia nasturtii]|uniref:uncharacterized protein LOC116344492 n=1 Tax=Contarinia nasturtii TaxID=265458 RepID=UPI0012D40BDD|nr:uncharacterized protein LOC116344492 [Contarinia nasturtii]
MNVNAFNHRINTWCKQTDCNFRITNQNVDLNDGVIGQSLSTDYIYFTLLTDNNRYEMFKMSLNPLKDCTASMENQSASPVKFLSMGQINLSKAAIEIDSNENMFFFMETDEIWCWNTKRSFTKENFHLFAELTFKNADRLQIIRNQQDKEELCAWSTEPQNFEIRNKRMEIKIGFAKFQIGQLINGGICGI